MEKKFLTIDELSQYLGIKKSNLYAKVERKEIPFYRFGRLIMFKKAEVDAFMEKCRVECFDIKKEAERVMKGANRSSMDIDRVVKKAIDEAGKKGYTVSQQEKPGGIEGLETEVNHGLV